ncbi:hypothetical protein pipiens_009522 [Culex pipiens pipiens]|uniref:Proteoglycan 4 n=1 Tax=Culex pipiens pipiens TaxID=38569 RepID=A0ABD1DH47_CULPP
MNRGGEGTPPATKSGRKVKRPAHFDDSPDTVVASPGKRKDTTGVSEAASAKKTARKTLVLGSAGTPPSAKNGSDSESGEVKKSSRKTLAKNGGSSREESPEPEVVKKVAPASARKTLLKSAVKNSSADGGTPKKTPAKKVEAEPEQVPEAGPGLSRTGRKIKVPAHLKEFEDVVVPAVTASRKSVAPKKDELDVEEKPAPKTPGKAKAAVVRQLATEHEDEKPAAKTPGKGKLTRKAAEDSEEEEEKPVTKTPGRGRSVARKAIDEEEEVKPAAKAPGRGRSMARKPSVDEVAFEEKPKTYGRARSVARQTEEEDKPAPKTPGKFVRKAAEEPEEETKPAPKTPARTKSAPRRFADAADEEEPKPAPKTPGRAKSMAARKPSVDEPAPAPKTPARRNKSMAPQATKPDETDPLALPDEPTSKVESPVKKPATKTPARAKSVAREPSPEPSVKPDSSEPAPTSRSGRKIKPKKYFGEFEQDESVPTVVAVAAATPKVVPASPVKTASPKVAAPSPIRSPQQIVKKGSPYAPKKDTPVATTTSPVKRLSIPVQQLPAAVSTKKAKKDDDGEGSPFKISPATEERQITKRNVNDHHHLKPETPKPASPVAAPKAVSPPKKASPKPLAVSTSDPELVLDRDPLASSSRSSVSTVPAESSAESTTPPKEEVDREEEPQQENKPKRGRKTLPAASSSTEDSELPKPAPKTPGRKTMAAAPAPAVAAEEPGSSRSGRKIKPKKFFDDAEATAAVTKSAAKPVKPETSATPAGRGKRKTIAPVVSSEEEEDEKQKKKKQNDDEDEPKASVSREEIMAIVGDFQDEAPPAVVTEATEAEPINGTTQEKSDAAPITDEISAAEEVDQPAEEPTSAATIPEPEIQDSTEAAVEEVAPESAGNFPETPIEQTPPLAALPQQTTAEAVPDDPAPSAEEPPIAEIAEASASSAFSEALLVEEESAGAAAAAASAGPTVEEKMEELFESVEFLEESGRLSDVAAAAAAVSDDVPAELLAQELGEVMGEVGETVGDGQEKEVVPEEEPAVAEPVEAAVEPQEPDQTDDLDNTEAPSALEDSTQESVAPAEDELNKTEPPASLNDTAEDVAQNEEDLFSTSMPDSVDEFFAENDRDQESITVLPEAPKQKEPALEQEELDLVGKLPEPQQSSSNTVAFVEIPDTPSVAIKQPTPATPKTPESKPAIAKDDDYSPDKPDAQEQASVPVQAPEIIEIFDSPIVATALEPAPKQATSTPVGKTTADKLTVKERLIQNSRKRSLSASDADLSTKKIVTFHSPANSTIMVETLDERLKKSLKTDSKSKNGRKRSLSEHREMGAAATSGPSDGPKPSKISKLPNFKNIHQNQFSRMESIAEYHNRKAQRAKEILTSSATKSPAPARNATPQKSAPQSGQKNGAGVAMQLKFGAAKPASHSAAASSSSSTTSAAAKLLSDEARQEKRQQQFKAAFKPRSEDGAGKSQDAPDGARRVVEQSRHKQHQILKGVRTNKRFELLMKFRDAAQD